MCTTSEVEREKFESLSRNRISNMSFTTCSIGEIIMLAIMVGILNALKSDASAEQYKTIQHPNSLLRWSLHS